MVENVGVLGATSPLGSCLLELLRRFDKKVTAFSRQPIPQVGEPVQWRQLGLATPDEFIEKVSCWVCIAPIWVLPDYFDLFEASGAKRVVALSSTSRYTKTDSSDPAEKAMVDRLVDNEQRLQKWAEGRGVEWVIIRPTLVYGLAQDKNITEIAHFIRRWGFFPILGKGNGLRQPVHVEDVAKACLVATTASTARNRAYEISGSEKIPYKEMIRRVFLALKQKPRFVFLPHWCFRIALLGLKLMPRFRHWSIGMAERMDRDMVFDHDNASSDLQFTPRAFELGPEDLPPKSI